MLNVTAITKGGKMMNRQSPAEGIEFYDDTYSLYDWVTTIDGVHTYQILDKADDCFNDFVHYEGPHNRSFYKSELRFATPLEIVKQISLEVIEYKEETK